MNIVTAANLYGAVIHLLNNPLPKSNVFNWGLNRNKRKFQAIHEDYVAQFQALTDPKIKEDLEKERMALVNVYGQRDDQGQLIQTPGQYLMTDYNAYSKAWAALLTKEPFATMIAVEKEFEKKMMDMPCDVEPYMVPFESLPDNLDANLLDAIAPMLKEPII